MRPHGGSTFNLAGWLFADLLLALAVLLTASGGFGIARAADPTPSPTPTPSAAPSPTRTPTPTPTPTPTQPSISVKAICRHLTVRGTALLAGDQGAVADAVSSVAQVFGDLNGRQGALVLTFGTAASPSRAHDLAHAMNLVLKSEAVRTRLGPLFIAAETRDYIQLDPDPRKDGEMWMELYLPPPLPAGAVSESGCSG